MEASQINIGKLCAVVLFCYYLNMSWFETEQDVTCGVVDDSRIMTYETVGAEAPLPDFIFIRGLNDGSREHAIRLLPRNLDEGFDEELAWLKAERDFAELETV